MAARRFHSKGKRGKFATSVRRGQHRIILDDDESPKSQGFATLITVIEAQREIYDKRYFSIKNLKKKTA